MFKSSIGNLIKQSKSLFEQINEKNMNVADKDDVQYSILNYKKILEDMTEYVKGYFDYKEQGEETYAGKLITSTHKFYDEMFTNIKYRTTITLYDMKRINQEFIAGTQSLQEMLENDDVTIDAEGRAFLTMTDNQYKKLMKVYKDDGDIYRWLVTKKSKFFNNGIPDQLRRSFNDKAAPVMHQLKGKR